MCAQAELKSLADELRKAKELGGQGKVPRHRLAQGARLQLVINSRPHNKDLSDMYRYGTPRQHYGREPPQCYKDPAFARPTASATRSICLRSGGKRWWFVTLLWL